MIRRFVFFSFLVSTLSIFAQSVPSLNWEYKEPRGEGDFIKLDNNGFMIIVGKTDYISSLQDYYRIKVIKQDRNGNVIWQYTYIDSLTGDKDRAFDVEIDTFNNIYVSGRTNWDGSLPPPDFSQSILFKLNTNGNLQWVRKWGNALGMGGGVRRSELFHNKFIYVVGYMNSWSTGYTNSFILQYDSSGVLNWADTTNYNYENYFVDIDIDKLGNAYATGVTACCMPGYDTRIVKYGLNGNIIWSKVLNDSIHLYLYPKVALIDDSANLYVGGDVLKTNAPVDFDLYMSKIDSSGSQKWLKTYASTNDSNWESIVGAVIDYKNDCYLYGYVLPYSSGGEIIGLITKINKQGVVEWSWNYDSIHGGESGVIYDGFCCSDSSIVFGGGGKPLNALRSGALFVSFKMDGTMNWIVEKENECLLNSIIEIDSVFFAAGSVVDTTHTYGDSLYTCKLSYDSSNSIYSNELNNQLYVYPNPFNEILNIEDPLSIKTRKITIYNILGKKIFEYNSQSSLTKINTLGLERGAYILEVEDPNKRSKYFKILKN